LEFAAEAEPGFEGLFAALFQDLPPIIGVERSSEVIEGVDGNDITLHIHRPEGVDGLVPGVLHTHGGGMVMLSAAGPLYSRWRDELAAAGLVVVGVEFRNGAGALGPNPFPAGLNDCNSGLEWMNENREALGIDTLILSGESGGGNLALANALLAKREGRLDHFDGIYALCPYISNAYAHKDQPLPSLVENDGYFLRSDMMGTLSAIYTPDDPLSRDPLAWPYHATVGDVSGLPPTVISVNELDLLRDEGLAFYRTLVRAGVPAVSRTVNGTTHAGDVIFRAAIPEVYLATIRDIHSFATSL
jgi:acetyl esterase/lipase